MTQLFAQPYDISATGFYFLTAEQYQEQSTKTRNDRGFRVEEYEIQFIDGESIDAKLFEPLGVNQCNFREFLDACDTWDESQKRKSSSPWASATIALTSNQAPPTILRLISTNWTACANWRSSLLTKACSGKFPSTWKTLTRWRIAP
jgi:hypothetical protein